MQSVVLFLSAVLALASAASLGKYKAYLVCHVRLLHVLFF